MNATEHVTRLWLETQGFFVMGPIRAGAREIDMLAVKPTTGATDIVTKVHVEVTVGGRPGGPADPGGLRRHVSQKFDAAQVQAKARHLLGDCYERWIVVGKLPGGQEKQWAANAEECGVRVLPFSQILREYLAANTQTPADDAGRLLDTLHQLGLINPDEQASTDH